MTGRWRRRERPPPAGPPPAGPLPAPLAVPPPAPLAVPPPAPLAVPPEDLRALVGRPGEDEFLAVETDLYEDLPPSAFDAVLDFGCGCGRQARWFLDGSLPRPRRYVGVDIHQGMLEWCRRHLAGPGVEFRHHDVRNPHLNPAGAADVAPLPDGPFSLVLAVSVFTHLTQPQAAFYLAELGRVAAPGAWVHMTWFLFDKAGFPMMQDFQDALYISADDPTNAVLYDRQWVAAGLAAAGFRLARIVPPAIRGFHWHVLAVKEPGEHESFPPDDAPVGRRPPPC